ncbi:flavodoxin domain-containing protein [Streptomyces sp. NPDC059506]|uniref:flavodoxin domain-containing protein n=1 Tax=Streptomyces sp. NPDC059506 TaxID=3347751 RepID=UPI0036B22A38
MRILVAHASKYGATEAIAERIAERLREAGHEAEARPVEEVGDTVGYGAFVIGSAVYFGKWLAEAARFVRRHRAELADGRPVWLFSTGPLEAPETVAAEAGEGQDVLADAAPEEIPEFTELLRARGHRVFFGALDPDALGLRDRLVRALPAGRPLLPEGDFRVWPDIDDWAAGIARELARA